MPSGQPRTPLIVTRQRVRPVEARPAQDNVIDLMAALKRSLGAGTEAPAAAAQASKKPARYGIPSAWTTPGVRGLVTITAAVLS